MSQKQKSNGPKIRARLSHPVVDSDGHLMEFQPAVIDRLEAIGGARVVARLTESKPSGMSANIGSSWRWPYEDRRESRVACLGWWMFPSNTLDRATSILPRLLYERLDEFGLDVSVLYPSMGLLAPHIDDEEVRRAACRAFNLYYAEFYRDFADRLIPVAVIPMHTPGEAMEELEYAVGTLGLKAVMLSGHVVRPLPYVERVAPEMANFSHWVDNLCLDSLYDYDPVWRKCIELKVAPTFHSPTMGLGMRSAISNYCFNHIGHFAAAAESICKAMFIGGVTRRFPELRCAFLEGGVGWAANLYSDLLGHWSKRNGEAMENCNPARFDLAEFGKLCQRYGNAEITKLVAEMAPNDADVLGVLRNSIAPAEHDDFWRCKIERPEDIKGLFVRQFYFGCEADDRMNAAAFNTKTNPYGARLKAIFRSDISHWDVPDMTDVLEEAYELVEEGIISEVDFRDFTFANPVTLRTEMNPEFFKGMVIESEVNEFLRRGSGELAEGNGTRRTDEFED